MFEFTIRKSHRNLGRTLMTRWTCLAILGLSSAAQALPAPCPADLNGDGAVGTVDLNYLLGAWGEGDPLADFDGDGLVGCFDLEYLQGNWGACRVEWLDINQDGAVTSLDRDLVVAHDGLDCRGDLNDNGTIDAADIDALLCLWGTDSSLADFDWDGSVGTTDLNFLLASFSSGCLCDLDASNAVNGIDLEIFNKGIGK